ncbi:hypothetical protein [Actinoallomurus sp. NPDC050550]|uniref:ATP-binding protein n=1 Tax=Actinoallomurus sp. NPDC050550 TaxID=3154937 RepID=UPI0033F9A422
MIQLCRQLEGLPLAVELAAVRMRVMTAQQLLVRLDDRFRLLRTQSPVAVDRQKTLQALIDWSYELCSPQERALWQRLSVFAGGCTLDAAERVCVGDPIAPEDTLDAMTGLVLKSIMRHELHDGVDRYAMLETLRQYGRDRLAASGQERRLRRRHGEWCRGLALRAEAEWFGEQQLDWAFRLRSEQPNLSAALEFCQDEPGEASTALEIAAALWSHRMSWRSPSEGHQRLARALALARSPGAVRAKAL